MALNEENDKMDDVQVTKVEEARLHQVIHQEVNDLQSNYEAQLSALKNKMEDQKKVLEENIARLLRRNAILEETVRKKEEEERHVAWELVREFKKEVKDKEVQTLELDGKNVAMEELEKRTRLDEWTIGKQEKIIQEKNEKIKELKLLVQQLRGEIEGLQGKRKVVEEERGDGEAKRLKVDEEKEEATKKMVEVPTKIPEVPKKKEEVTEKEEVPKKKALETVEQERLSDSEEDDKVEDELNGTKWKYDLSWRASESFELPVITDELAILVSCCVPMEYNKSQEEDAKMKEMKFSV